MIAGTGDQNYLCTRGTEKPGTRFTNARRGTCNQHCLTGDSGIQSGTVVVNSPTSLTVPLAVSTSATTGFHTVTVTTLGEVATQQFAFTVIPSVATLNEAIPNQAEQGVQNLTVRLIGQYTHFTSASTATLGAGITIVSVANVSATEEDAVINIDPLSYTGGRLGTVSTPNVSCAYQPPVAVTYVTYVGCTPGSSSGTGTEIVTANVFNIIQGPAIISNVSPNTGNEGQEVVFNITGSATHWAQNFTQFYIAGGGSDIDARLSPDGRYLLVDGSGMHFVSVFAVNGGTLTELAGSPTPLPSAVTSSAGIVNI